MSAALAAQAASASDTFVAKTSAEQWAGTPVSFDLLKKFLKQENCYGSTPRFIGCIQALNALGSAARPRQAVITPEMGLGDPAYYGAVQHSFGPVSAALLLNDTAAKHRSVMQAQSARRVRKDTAIVAMTLVYNDQTAGAIDFDAAVDYFAGQVANKDDEALIAAIAINSYYSSARDPHTSIGTIAAFLDEDNTQSLIGIGVVLYEKDEWVVIGSPNENSPAHRAGVRAKDTVVAIDGKSAKGLGIDKVRSMILGTEGSRVVLTVARNGRTVDIPVIRERIVTQPVRSRIIKDRGINYGYVRFDSFGEQTCGQVFKAIRRLENQGARGLVLDLRDNPGGIVDGAVCIAAIFVGSNRVVLRSKSIETSRIREWKTNGTAGTTRLPTITLINSRSASASEILAGALRDHQRSWVVGTRSFGKGTIQQVGRWSMNGEIVPGVVFNNTVERFYQPSGFTNQVYGITPNFAIDPFPNASDEDRFTVHESDLYTNAIPPLGKPWHETRPAEAQKVEQCVASTGRAKQLYAERESDAIPPDYQLLAAQDYLTCALR